MKKKISLFSMMLWIVFPIWFNVAQIIAGSAWSNPSYSWRNQNVSDLGETTAPLHTFMNITFIIQGLVIILGVWSIGQIWKKTKFATVTRIIITLASLGFVVAGFAPADTQENLHVVLGAFPIFIFGNLGLLFVFFASNREYLGKLRFVAPILGLLGIIGGLFFFSENYLGIGQGSLERIWAYVLLVWTFVLGIYGLISNKDTPA
jgi:hypothetical membrane protein